MSSTDQRPEEQSQWPSENVCLLFSLCSISRLFLLNYWKGSKLGEVPACQPSRFQTSCSVCKYKQQSLLRLFSGYYVGFPGLFYLFFLNYFISPRGFSFKLWLMSFCLRRATQTHECLWTPIRPSDNGCRGQRQIGFFGRKRTSEPKL